MTPSATSTRQRKRPNQYPSQGPACAEISTPCGRRYLLIVSEDVAALAVYGLLAPGEKNHWVVRSIEGEWNPGVVRGFEFDVTWGPAEGYEGFLPDESGNDVAVMVLESDHLDKNFRSVDDFQGEGFVRQIVPVTLADGTIIHAWIYVALTDS